MAMTDRRPLGLPVASAHASPSFNRAEPVGMSPTIHDLKGPFESDGLLPLDSVSPTSGMSPTLRSISPDLLMASGFSVKKSASSVSLRDVTPPKFDGFDKPAKLEPHAFLKLDSFDFGKFDVEKPKKKPPPRVPIATGISTTIPVTGEKPRPEQEGDASLEDDVLFAIFLILYEKDLPGAGMTVKQICDVLVERHPEMAQLLSKTSNLVSAKLNAYVKRVEKGDSNLKYALSREWADALPKRMVYVYRGLLAKDFHVHVKNAMDKLAKFVPAPFPDDAKVKPRRQTMFDLGAARPAFSESPETANLFVPYSLAPVAANMAAEETLEEPKNDLDFDIDDLEVFNDTDDDEPAGIARNKRLKSMSSLVNKKAKFVTAAAAAPRAPKTPCTHSPNAAAAAAALHAAALKAINGPLQKKMWAVRLFLAQEVGHPEDVSLLDLDKLFS